MNGTHQNYERFITVIKVDIHYICYPYWTPRAPTAVFVLLVMHFGESCHSLWIPGL